MSTLDPIPAQNVGIADAEESAAPEPERLIMVTNFFEELKCLVLNQ